MTMTMVAVNDFSAATYYMKGLSALRYVFSSDYAPIVLVKSSSSSSSSNNK